VNRDETVAFSAQFEGTSTTLPYTFGQLDAWAEALVAAA
jgi:hypothetical protein